MRHLATIRKINDIQPIPNADKIELAIIDGWQCVISKEDGFKVGNLVVYIEIDSVLPDRPEFEFMRKYKFRVKTIKLRGQVSQGLVLPLSILGDVWNEMHTPEEGMDVTEYMGIKKYDPEAAQEKKWYMNIGQKIEFPWWLKPFKSIKFIRNWWISKHKTVTDFPAFIKKTDEERIQNMPILFNQLKKERIPLTVTEKVDGTSATYFYDGNKFGVCSRNKWILKNDGSPYWKVAEQYNIEDILRNIYGANRCKLVVLQGEILGQNIQKNKYGIHGFMLTPFNLIVDNKRLDYDKMKEMLTFTLLKCVPRVGVITVSEDWDIQNLVEYAKGASVWRDKNKPREGIVCRNESKHISFKVINPDFLLKEED